MSTRPTPTAPPSNARGVRQLLERSRRLFVLTGAGCSTASGIPTYRDEAGAWKRRPPITFAAFTGAEATRRRYWARSCVGYRRMAEAQPNAAHTALANLERERRVALVVTQNVDRLHQRAGSEAVLDLHGRLDEVICLGCVEVSARADLQERLLESNPAWGDLEAATAPDGDADLELDSAGFRVPGCRRCGGMLKPHLVFFGESVPKDRVARAYDAVRESDALLVVGSSLQIFSGWRFVRAAHEQGLPIALVNLGVTRADDIATARLTAPAEEALPSLTTLDTEAGFIPRHS